MSDDLRFRRLVNLLREHGIGEADAEQLARVILAFLAH
jgi:hypothetical protein